MKLENLNLVELNAQEVISIDGGELIINNNPDYSFITTPAKNTCKAVLGFLAGVGDGLRAAMQ